MRNQRGAIPLSVLGTALALWSVGCGGEAGEEPPEEQAGTVEEGGRAMEFSADLEQMTQTPSGLYVQDLKVGDGAEAVAGEIVQVHYTGWLMSGEKFDSSLDRGAPFPFQLGAGRVIPGWDEGVAGMLEGGRRKLVIPPELAYGERGYPPVIPPDATLVFEVELLQVGEGG
jgi:FKBP-type peptidyl-prolyl cis-trans isomerase